MNSNGEISKILNSASKSINSQNPNVANVNLNTKENNNDPDEQFVLDIIRSTKGESINSLIEMLRLQESKSVLLIRILERYAQQLDSKDLFK